MKSVRLLLACLLLTAACSDDDEETATLPCNVASRACQKAVFKATVEARGQEGASMPPVRVISREQLAEELRADVGNSAAERDEAAARRAKQSQQAMALLRLLPEPAEQSADDAYVEQAVSGIAAYYSSYSKDITVISDQAEDEDNGSFTLSHEFVHALQDQRENLSKWREPLIKTSDDQVSTKCLTEGEAVWLSYVTMYAAVRLEPAEAIDRSRIFPSMLSAFLRETEKSSAPFLSALETLPYPMGGKQVSDIYLAEGPEALPGLYSAPRLTLRGWADDAPDALPEPLDCKLPAAPEGYTRITGDRLGFGGLLAFHTALGWDGASAYDGALSWRADDMVGYASSTDAEAVAVAWRLRLESTEAAEALAQLARDAQIDAVAREREVLITGSTVPELAASWLPHDSCLPRDKARHTEPPLREPTLAERLGIER